MKTYCALVSLKEIRLENVDRKPVDIHDLAESIQITGIVAPLIVEQIDERDYILLDGFRRYNALTELGIEETYCLVRPCTSKANRLYDQLLLEINTKPLTAEQVVRHVEKLLDMGVFKVLSESIPEGELHRLLDTVPFHSDLKRHLLHLYKNHMIEEKTLKFIVTIYELPGFEDLDERTKVKVVEAVLNRTMKP
ncbi:hypothetical protein JCM19037_2827 [Geomicrobium sp. JCM 19037]|uniref:ParB/Srx family N-terminal domain-containing protein n=1 Tax=unclassified Geomicrobium TaxID=2628951 RepID=UPI00045F34E2|nr:ParB/Srx family N-terminal domain-containing protein [Geomicrobium sp. JCM 19037]GAK04417.1 hypothetical protein JCM19037_2827 [Geomicrobium sp. JCM 19037]